MSLMEEPVFQWMAQYAYEPWMVYSAIVALMFASSFGLPIPEELTLLSAGLIAYMGSHPEIFPPPYEGAQGVSVFGTAMVCFVSVFVSDGFVFMLGRVFGRKWVNSRRFEKVMSPEILDRIGRWTARHGMWACGIFRFTPGLRFPGHMAYGALGFPLWKFAAVDGTAALISVPTQIFLVAAYGEKILLVLQQFKFILLLIIVSFLIFFAMRRVILWWMTREASLQTTQGLPPRG